jgi:hypothetical protein
LPRGGYYGWSRLIDRDGNNHPAVFRQKDNGAVSEEKIPMTERFRGGALDLNIEKCISRAVRDGLPQQSNPAG